MATNLKEFTDLLLNNLKSLDGKVDELQKDMSRVRSDVAVLKETKEAVKSLSVCIDDLQTQLNRTDRDLAIKSSKWGVISSVVTLLIALLIAFISGVFEVRQEHQQEPQQPFTTRGFHPTKIDSTNSK